MTHQTAPNPPNKRVLWMLVAALLLLIATGAGYGAWRYWKAEQRKAELAALAKRPKPKKIIEVKLPPVNPDSVEAMIRSNRKIANMLRDNFRKLNFRVDTTMTYSYNFIDLNGDKKDEAIVYLEGNGFCYVQGCSVAVLTKENGEYTLKSALMPADVPIFVSESRTNGWRDLVVTVLPKDYSQPSKRLVRYLSAEDGYGYPADPTTMPKPWEAVTEKGITILTEQHEEMYKFRFVPDRKTAKDRKGAKDKKRSKK